MPKQMLHVKTVRKWVNSTFPPGSDPILVEEISTQLSSASPEMALAMIREMQGSDKRLAEALRELKVGVTTINRADHTDVEAAKEHGIEVVYMSGVGHFGMLEDSIAFNQILDDVVGDLMQ